MRGIEGGLRVVACVRESLPGPSCTAWPPDHAPVPGVTDFMQFPRKNPPLGGEAFSSLYDHRKVQRSKWFVGNKIRSLDCPGSFSDTICGLFHHWNPIMHGDAVRPISSGVNCIPWKSHSKKWSRASRKMCEGGLCCSDN